MRLNKTVVTERENFVRELFRTSPTLTGLEVQGKLKERFGKIMRPNRIYELKREVVSQIVVVGGVNTTTTSEVVPSDLTVVLAPTGTVDTQVSTS